MYTLHEDDRDNDCNRKFTLVSSGCEVLRITKSVIKNHLDETTIRKIQSQTASYPTDEELYHTFKRFNNWRCFREQLVDHIAEYKSNVDKAFKERCATIPKVPKIKDAANLSRAETPTEHLDKLVDKGYIKKSKLTFPTTVNLGV